MGGGSTPQFKPPTGIAPGFPDYTNFLDPENIGQAGVGSEAYQTASGVDTSTIAQTFANLRLRAPDFFKSMKLEGRHLLDLERGIDPNAQAVQNAALRAGLTTSAGAFGDATNNEAGIARHLGANIGQYAQGLREERRATLSNAAGLPINQPIQVGYTGKDALELAMQEAANKNNYNTAGYQAAAGLASTELQGQIAGANQKTAQQGAAVGAIGAVLAGILVAF